MQLNKRFSESDSLANLLKSSVNKRMLELKQVFIDALKSYTTWFDETKLAWFNNFSADLTGNDAKAFAITGENYRVVLFGMISLLEKVDTFDNTAKQLWVFIETVASKKGIALTRWADGLTPEEYKAKIKTLKSEIAPLSIIY